MILFRFIKQEEPLYFPRSRMDYISKTDFPTTFYLKEDFERRMAMEAKKKSEQAFNPAFGQLIEMAYWMVKFEGDFNKNYEDSKLGKSGEDDDRLFGINSRTFIKFIRYFLKFFGSFEKLLKVLK